MDEGLGGKPTRALDEAPSAELAPTYRRWTENGTEFVEAGGVRAELGRDERGLRCVKCVNGVNPTGKDGDPGFIPCCVVSAQNR